MNLKENAYFRLWAAIPPQEKKKIIRMALVAGGLSCGLWFSPWRKAIPFVGSLGLFCADTFCPQINFFSRVFWRGQSNCHFALSFDDGPDPTITLPLIELIEKYQARATFFLLVERAQRHPQVLRRIKVSRHEIGLHGFDHRKVYLMPPGKFIKFVEDSKKHLEDLTGEKIIWYRPPHGFLRFDQFLLLQKLGLKVAGWTIGVWDTDEDVTEEEIYARLKKNVRAGDIVLLHDGVADRERPQQAMLKALDSFLAVMSAKKIKAITVNDLWIETESG